MVFIPFGQKNVFSALMLMPFARAFWILDPSSLVQERLDPIVNPGQVSNHVHNIAGGSAFGPDSSFESLQSSECSSVPVQVDNSGYWAPQMYHHGTDGKLTLIPIAFLNFYYLQRGGSEDVDALNVKAFPEGLRMIAGDPTRTSYDGSKNADKAVDFKCLDYDGTTTTTNEFPPHNCPDGLRAQIVFPSCWDGVNLDSDDHKSHMSYPLGDKPDSGNCPDTHPVKLVTMFHEWVFDVNSFDFVPGAKNWVLSFGDETGYGFHADFLNGWNVQVLQDAIDQCRGDLFQNIEGCPPFVEHIDRERAKTCKIERVVDEEIDGPLDILPGCQTIPFTGFQKCDVVPAIKGYTGGIGSPSTPANATTTATPSPTNSASNTFQSRSSTSSASSTAVVSSPSGGTCKRKRHIVDSRSVKRHHIRHAQDISF